jgi:putative restriction endonuclease
MFSRALDSSPIALFADEVKTYHRTRSRPNQQRFKFACLRRYGAGCAICDIQRPVLRDATHLVEKRHRGSDDPRNGLVLCALHNRAFDTGLIAFHPTSLAVMLAKGVSPGELSITRSDLRHLAAHPDAGALSWSFDRWEAAQQV